MTSYDGSSLQAQTVGVIFRGGQGRRLGGVDKGMLRVGGATLLERTASRLAPQCATLAISGGPAERGGLEVVPDDAPGEGPLRALLGVMRWAASQTGARFLLTSPVDTPFLPLDLGRRLHGVLCDRPAGSAVAASEGRLHHLNALFALSVLPLLEDLVEAKGERRVGALHAALGSVPVPFGDGDSDPFMNVNTPEDLARAEARARAAGPVVTS
ncbi:molybdenum cofactor guanylyltransferase [Parvularcula dongshanensis]|uniref:Molybdenum cofactor guanylyltransferase n=1 Tax=Parvularcula dongshanensis TaxID=1173995 RepID=A0A840I5T1_9PROT|nr:molybdenum cofactor guanylyltransferase [Parvularcula dongshanensis]MBB4660167.1 molybdopterin-guanine dinucleotide biosynthesis protein A [Parvularcula dongshanensis]